MRISEARTAKACGTERWRKRWSDVPLIGENKLIDTANIYGYGESEEIIAEAIIRIPLTR